MSENILAQFLRSEKDLRPYWETDHRGMVLPLIKSGYNNSVSYGLPGILGGSAPSVLNDILQGRMVEKGEIEQGATDAAGAAMTGSLALSRPSGSIGSGGRPETPSIRAYRGVDTGAPKSIGNRTSMFASSNPEVADAYANAFGGYDRGAVMPVEMNFSNPFVVNAKGAHWTEIPHNGDIISTEELAALARRSGHDGMIVNNVIDTNSKSQTQVPSTTYAGLRPGTVRNAITGDLLYANAPTSASAPLLNYLARQYQQE